MTKTCIYLLVLAISFSACSKKTEQLFAKTADERLAEVLTNYQTALTGAPGYKLFVYPEGLASEGISVGGLTYYLKFAGNNRVTMISDFTAAMAMTPKESGYNLKSIQQPSLVFDTYSYIHVPADPDPDVSGSPAGAGLGRGSDFDFAILKTDPSDSITLKGNFNKSEAILIKIEQTEIDEAFNGGLANIVQSTADYSSSNLLLYFNGMDNTRISVSMDMNLNIILLRYFNANDELIEQSARFSYTIDGVHFKNPVTIGGYTFQDLIWDNTGEVYYIQSGSTRVNFINASTHIIPLAKILGLSLTTLSVPVDPLPGQSGLFRDNYNQAKSDIKNGGYNLDLGKFYFIFDDASKTMLLDIELEQEGNGFLAEYTYSYTINKNTGILNFTLIDRNGNAETIENDMSPILGYLNDDRFSLDYNTASNVLLGNFTSIENPDFFFTVNIDD